MPVISAYARAKTLITSIVPAVKPLSLQYSTSVSLKLACHSPQGSTPPGSACRKKKKRRNCHVLYQQGFIRHTIWCESIFPPPFQPLSRRPGPRPFCAALLTLKKHRAETFPFKKLVDIVIRHQRARCHFEKAL